MMRSLLVGASALALTLPACTQTFDQGLRDNIGRGCAAWSGAYAIFQTAASAGQIPAHLIARVEQGNLGVATVCAQRENIVDIYSAAQAVANAYVVVVRALREADVPSEFVE